MLYTVLRLKNLANVILVALPLFNRGCRYVQTHRERLQIGLVIVALLTLDLIYVHLKRPKKP